MLNSQEAQFMQQFSYLKHVETRAKQQIAELDGLLLWHRISGDFDRHRDG
jgi:hypothetical protein